MLSGLFGSGIGQAIGIGYGQQLQQATQSYGYQQLQASAQQQAIIGQQQMAAGSYQGIIQPMTWMFDGVLMSIMDFADKIWPEDCADKTHFILKYSKGE